MRVIYNACFADPWLKVAMELNNKYEFEPIYWIGYEDDDSEKLVPELFPNTVYHRYFDAWKGIFPEAISRDYGQAHIDIDFIRDYAGYELQALKMMDRMDPDRHSFSFIERQRHFRNLVKYWTAVIRSLKPELVISAVFPHRVYDYVLYLLCSYLHIPFLSFQNTAFAGRIIPTLDIYAMNGKIGEDYENILKTATHGNGIESVLAPDILHSYRSIRNNQGWIEPEYMAANKLKHRNSANAVLLFKKFISDLIHFPDIGRYLGSNGYLMKGFPTYHKRRNKSIEKSNLNIVQYALNKISTNKYKRKLNDYYERRAVNPDFSGPYIFLPLHYQPERTSNPAGDIFVDQSLCVETLAKNIPAGWKIYVKEHPAQFHAHNEGHTSRIREFYDDLLKFPCVRLVPMQCDSLKLISNAKAVATVTGTVGWEALARGKPVLIFGSAWYEGYPGVLKISRDGAAAEIIDFIGKFYFDENKMLAFLAAVEKNSLRAYYYRGLKSKMAQPEKECVDSLVDAIIRHVPSR